MRGVLTAGLVALALLAAGCASGDRGATTADGEGSEQDQAIVVPGIRGGSVSSAFFNLRRAGLRVQITEPFVDGSLRGGPNVLDQSPAGGTVVPAGSIVKLGRLRPGAAGSPDVPIPIPTALVPDFTGKPVADAVAWAQHAELFWDASFPPLPPSDAPTLLQAYVVTGQQPAPGSRLARVEGSRVTPLILETAPA